MKKITIIIVALLVTLSAGAQDLQSQFLTPPNSAKVFTWWHWMNGNISKEGITADLEAMAKAGVGGVQAFNIGIMTQGPVDYASDEWFDLTNHAIKEAQRLGIEFDMHNCPGWSSSGGFWITPAQAGKQLSWSMSYVSGGKKIDVTLPQPTKALDSYWDEAVIAYPSTKDEALIEKYLIKASVDGQPVTPALFSMNGVDHTVRFEKEIILEFSQLVSAQSLNGFIKNEPQEVDEATRMQMRNGFGGGPSAPAPTFCFSTDGITYTKPQNISLLADAVSFASFAQTSFKYVKIEAKGPVLINGLQLSGAPMNENFLRKADYEMSAGGMMFNPMGRNAAPAAKKDIDSAYLIDPAKVIDLSSKMDAQGHLVWEAPRGDWTIIRMGYVPVDRHTKVGSTVGDGLELDKYSREALKFHWDYLYPRLLPALSSAAKTSKAGLLIDSYEVGNSNWTPLMQQEFKDRRGYDMLGYLPTLFGKYVGSEDTTERFMWDFRRTCADMFADNYLQYMAELCHEHDILLYNEPYNTSVFDEMQVGSRADIPMGEFWVRTHQDRNSLKLASSIAHVNGKRVGGNQIVGGESYTGWSPDASYQNFPYSLKAQGDDAYTMGLNRFIFHRFAHQPNVNATPGMSMGNIGFHFDKNNTWFDMGSAWLKYAARCQYMLQQGTIVADALYLLNEEVPASAKSAWNPELPFGYFGDALNAEMFLQKVSIAGSELVAADNIRYRMLLLQQVPQGRVMTLAVLKKIEDYVDQGGLVCGFAPVRTPGMNAPQELSEFSKITEKLWGGIEKGGTKRVGKGYVLATTNVQEAIDLLHIAPDLELSFEEDAPINFIHRQANNADIYFLANHRRTTENLVATFRVNNKQPELWNASTGEIIPLSVYDVLPDGRVKVDLTFEPVGSWFVVFRQPASDKRMVSVSKDGQQILQTADFAKREGGFYPDIHGTFTITAWIRPESNSSLQGGARLAMWGGAPNSSPYALGNGEALYGKGHAVAGLCSTRSGVSVLEKSGLQSTPVLVDQDKVASWNHVALVYNQGVPWLYINGKLKQTGKASGKIVHPSYKDIAISANNLNFEGDFEQYTIYDKALSAAEIDADFQKGEPNNAVALYPVQYAPDGDLMFFENGTYALKHADGQQETVQINNVGTVADLTAAPWTVRFPAMTGAPESIQLSALIPLQKHESDGVKYFSGTASYNTHFKLSASAIKGKTLYLDLGRVYVIAEVILNGKSLGICWKAPYKIDITDAAVAGENKLEVKVANLWPNRLIGDAQTPDAYSFGDGDSGVLPDWYLKGEKKPDDGKVAFSVVKFFNADEPLYDSGLVGPVVIRTAIKK